VKITRGEVPGETIRVQKKRVLVAGLRALLLVDERTRRLTADLVGHPEDVEDHDAQM